MNPSLPGDLPFWVDLSAVSSSCSVIIPSIFSDCSSVNFCSMAENNFWILQVFASHLSGCCNFFCKTLFCKFIKYFEDFSLSSYYFTLHQILPPLVFSSMISSISSLVWEMDVLRNSVPILSLSSSSQINLDSITLSISFCFFCLRDVNLMVLPLVWSLIVSHSFNSFCNDLFHHINIFNIMKEISIQFPETMATWVVMYVYV